MDEFPLYDEQGYPVPEQRPTPQAATPRPAPAQRTAQTSGYARPQAALQARSETQTATPVARPIAPKPMQRTPGSAIVVDIEDDKIKFRDYQNMVEWLDHFRKTANVPAHFKNNDVSVIVQAVQLLINMGLPWMSFLSKTSYVNNQLGVMSDAIAAAVRATGLLEVDELVYYDKEGKPDSPSNVQFEAYAAVYTGKRKGDRQERWYRYSMKDKEKQGLGRGGGAWASNPRDMMKHRARTRVLRDLFPDVIGGVHVPEVDDTGSPASRPGVSEGLKNLLSG